MSKVVNLLIGQVELQNEKQNRLEFVTETYHEFIGEKDASKGKEEFIKYLKEKIDKINKDRASDSVSDDKREEVPKSK